MSGYHDKYNGYDDYSDSDPSEYTCIEHGTDYHPDCIVCEQKKHYHPDFEEPESSGYNGYEKDWRDWGHHSSASHDLLKFFKNKNAKYKQATMMPVPSENEESNVRYPKLLKTLKTKYARLLEHGDEERTDDFRNYLENVRHADNDYEETKRFVERDRGSEDPGWTQKDLDDARNEFHDTVHGSAGWIIYDQDIMPRNSDFCELCEEDENKTKEGFKVI